MLSKREEVERVMMMKKRKKKEEERATKRRNDPLTKYKTDQNWMTNKMKTLHTYELAKLCRKKKSRRNEESERKERVAPFGKARKDKRLKEATKYLKQGARWKR